MVGEYYTLNSNFQMKKVKMICPQIRRTFLDSPERPFHKNRLFLQTKLTGIQQLLMFSVIIRINALPSNLFKDVDVSRSQ